MERQRRITITFNADEGDGEFLDRLKFLGYGELTAFVSAAVALAIKNHRGEYEEKLRVRLAEIAGEICKEEG